MYTLLLWIALILFLMIILLILLGQWANHRFYRSFLDEVDEAEAQLPSDEAPVIHHKDLDHIPEPMRGYLLQSGWVGNPFMQKVHLRQAGTFRMKPGAKWYPLSAEETFFAQPPAFFWWGSIQLGPWLGVQGKDVFYQGKGHMVIKPLSLWTLAEISGPEADEAELMRYLSELVWMPTAFLQPNIQWEAVDERTVRSTLTEGELAVTGTWHFDEAGDIRAFRAERLRDTGKGQPVLTPWETPITAYEVFDGIRIPVRAQAIWKLPEGDFSYIDLEIEHWEWT